MGLNESKVVTVGGGTGMSTMLRGLRRIFSNITAIVSVADDGGSSGQLRREYHMLPPGDIRNCVSALADGDARLDQFLNFRFQDGSLMGHTVGNVILAALNEMSGDFEEAVDRFCNVFHVGGRVLPVTGEDIVLCAELDDGRIIRGEHNIGVPRDDKTSVRRVFLEPQAPPALKAAEDALRSADIIVLGPGSLYTSVIPNLLADGICCAIRESKAKKIYVCNVMTQPGETDGYTVYDHLSAIERHAGGPLVDFVLANNQALPPGMAARYSEDHAFMVEIDEDRFADSGIALVKANMLLVRDEYIRHNFSRLARVIQQIAEM